MRGTKYEQRIFCKFSPFYKRRLESDSYSYICPGCLPHMHVRKHKPIGMFRRWLDRGNKAYGVFWRTHLSEYPFNRKKKMSVTAEIVENFNWIQFATMRGLVFRRDGVWLNGMITVHLNDLENSFEQEWTRYSTRHFMAIYEHDVNGNVVLNDKGNRIQIGLVAGAFSELTKEEAWAAVQGACA